MGPNLPPETRDLLTTAKTTACILKATRTLMSYIFAPTLLIATVQKLYINALFTQWNVHTTGRQAKGTEYRKYSNTKFNLVATNF